MMAGMGRRKAKGGGRFSRDRRGRFASVGVVARTVRINAPRTAVGRRRHPAVVATTVRGSRNKVTVIHSPRSKALRSGSTMAGHSQRAAKLAKSRFVRVRTVGVARIRSLEGGGVKRAYHIARHPVPGHGARISRRIAANRALRPGSVTRGAIVTISN